MPLSKILQLERYLTPPHKRELSINESGEGVENKKGK